MTLICAIYVFMFKRNSAIQGQNRSENLQSINIFALEYILPGSVLGTKQRKGGQSELMIKNFVNYRIVNETQ